MIKKVSMSDYLQEAVDQLEVPQGLPYNVALFHYLRGSNNNLYELRRTNVVPGSQTRLHELGRQIVSQQISDESLENADNLEKRESDLHRRSMQEYIKYLDRDNTFLSLILKKFQLVLAEDPFCNSCFGNLSIIDSPNRILREVPADSIFSVKWEIDSESASLLSSVCTNIENTNQERFFENIYHDRKIGKHWKDAFKYARADLFGKLSNGEMTFEEKRSTWDLISSIQGILVFLSAVNPHNSSFDKIRLNLSCSFSIYKKNPPIYKETELAVTIISPSLDSNNISKLSANRHKKSIDRMFQDIEIARTQGGLFSRLNDVLRLNDINAECLTFIKEAIYHSSRPQTNIDEAQWAILLTYYLANKKHEGRLLDFFIVCGELSQFNDLPQIKFRNLSSTCKEALQWTNNNEFNELIEAEKVARQIAHEHYPWFDSGRYALFWNTASAIHDNTPIGLISIENFNWINIVESQFRDRPPFAMPNCLICHVYGYPQKIGVQIVENNQVKELLRWQDNKWKSIINESRKENLKCLLESLLKPTNNIDKMIDIISHVAEHPEKGGTIVFVENNETLDEFGDYKKDMGTPWNLQEITSEDVISLVSQDGATLCPVNIENSDVLDLQYLQYRKLLLSKDSAIGLLNLIQNQWKTSISCGEADWPLAAKGSRRWNSAIAACNHLVNTVVVISQDGDIQIWHIDNNITDGKTEADAYTLDGIRLLAIYEFPLKGEHKLLGSYPKSIS
jgi:hypothetical protein